MNINYNKKQFNLFFSRKIIINNKTASISTQKITLFNKYHFYIFISSPQEKTACYYLLHLIT